MERFKLPSQLSESYLTQLLKVIRAIVVSKYQAILLDWSSVEAILPAGWAMLACLDNLAGEHQVTLHHVGLRKKDHNRAPLLQLTRSQKKKGLPEVSAHDDRDKDFLLQGKQGGVDIEFTELLSEVFQNRLSPKYIFSVTLILNELMQNTLDHSTSERYYLYAGLNESHFHFGLLDLGVTLPAKLEWRYPGDQDYEYLNLALKAGITTRRQRSGGVGLHHALDLTRPMGGQLIMLSRWGGLRRYFRFKKVYRKQLKGPIPGTWTFIRFPL